MISSVIAAWADVSSVLSGSLPAVSTGVSLNSLQNLAGAVLGLNIGYLWMLLNCVASAAYVSVAYFPAARAISFILQVLSMRKKIKATGFSDWDSMFYNNLLSIPILALFSIISEDWGTDNLAKNL